MKTKQNISFFALVTFLSFFGYASAQWANPVGSPPGSNIPAPITAGGLYQSKIGSSAAIGIAQSIAGMTIPDGFGFMADTSIGIDLPGHRNSTAYAPSGWVFTGDQFAIDTNSAISVGDIFSTGRVVAMGNLKAKNIIATDLKSINTASTTPARLCVLVSTGKLISCGKPATVAGSDRLFVTLNSNKQFIPVNTADTVILTWTSNAVNCQALSGAGFYTAGSPSGSDVSNTITLTPGQSETFTIACADIEGHMVVSTINIGTQMPPGITLVRENPATLYFGIRVDYQLCDPDNPDTGNGQQCPYVIPAGYVNIGYSVSGATQCGYRIYPAFTTSTGNSHSIRDYRESLTSLPSSGQIGLEVGGGSSYRGLATDEDYLEIICSNSVETKSIKTLMITN